MTGKMDNIHHILLSGLPGKGKTTVVMKVCDLLSNMKVPIVGFYTKEKRSGNLRSGFDVIALDGSQGPLARLGGSNDGSHKNGTPRVGRYEVDLRSFESVALPSLINSGNKSVVIIDEIGRMELFSKLFQQIVIELFKKNIIILATVPALWKAPNFK